MQVSPALVFPFLILTFTGGAAGASAPGDSSPGAANADVCPVTGITSVAFRDAVTASSFHAADGRELILSSVIGPGEDGDILSADASRAARDILASALSGRHLSIAIAGTPDRYRRIPVQLFADNAWMQEAMVRQGWLRVSADQQPGACAAPLLAAENQAITARAGHWRDGAYRLRTPDQLSGRGGRFETLEGEVWRVRLLRGAAVIEFINASSFQLKVPAPAVRQFRSTRFDIRRLRDRNIRVRGWIGIDGMPSIEVSNPALIEIRENLPTRRK